MLLCQKINFSFEKNFKKKNEMKGGLGGILKNIFFEPWDQGLFKNIGLFSGAFFFFQPFLQQAVASFDADNNKPPDFRSQLTLGGRHK